MPRTPNRRPPLRGGRADLAAECRPIRRGVRWPPRQPMSDRRPMSLTRILVRNIASSWAGYGAQVIVAFALTPYILGSLGQTRYGIWALALGLTGYYGLLDLGLGAGITQYLTRYLAVKDYKSLNAAASTGVVALTSVGALVLLVSVAIAFNASSLFRIPSGSATEVAMVIAITG